MASNDTLSYDNSQHKAVFYLCTTWYFGTHKKKKTPCTCRLTNENVRQGNLYCIWKCLKRLPCVVLQVASLLYVLHHIALHVAFQYIHHSHGDANRGGSAPGASECWGGVWGHQYCRQHHYWRKRANRYLSIMAILFSSLCHRPDMLIHIIQILLRSELSDLYHQRQWSVLFILWYFFWKMKENFEMWWENWNWEIFMLN